MADHFTKGFVCNYSWYSMFKHKLIIFSKGGWFWHYFSVTGYALSVVFGELALFQSSPCTCMYHVLGNGTW